MDAASLHALRQRLDADSDVVVAWLVKHPTAWLPHGEQLPTELCAGAQTRLAAS